MRAWRIVQARGNVTIAARFSDGTYQALSVEAVPGGQRDVLVRAPEVAGLDRGAFGRSVATMARLTGRTTQYTTSSADDGDERAAQDGPPQRPAALARRPAPATRP